jgi:hypothetical protein
VWNRTTCGPSRMASFVARKWRKNGNERGLQVNERTKQSDEKAEVASFLTYCTKKRERVPPCSFFYSSTKLEKRATSAPSQIRQTNQRFAETIVKIEVPFSCQRPCHHAVGQGPTRRRKVRRTTGQGAMAHGVGLAQRGRWPTPTQGGPHTTDMDTLGVHTPRDKGCCANTDEGWQDAHHGTEAVLSQHQDHRGGKGLGDMHDTGLARSGTRIDEKTAAGLRVVSCVCYAERRTAQCSCETCGEFVGGRGR